MRSLRWFPIVVLLVVASCDKKPKAELTSPKQVAKAFLQACYDNDVEKAKACVLEGAAQEKLAVGMTAMMSGMRKAADAIYKKWGESIKTQSGQTIKVDPAEIDSAVEAVSGESATLTLTGNGRVIPLKKRDGQWKVDVLGFAKVGGNPMGDEAAADVAQKMFTAMGAVGEGVAADVEAGKHATPQAAVGDLALRMRNALAAEAKWQRKP